MRIKTIASIVGARPQFIKAASVSRALSFNFKEIFIHTGQHYDHGMSEIFFDEMEMRPPDFNLGIGSGSHGEQTGKMLMALEKIFEKINPDCVLVYGDTNSTLSGALAAAKAQIPIAHVEAGLRSYNRTMPEEINRVLTDHVSSLLFCPTNAAVTNLAQEGITKGVHHVGDVMYDTLLRNLEILSDRSQILKKLNLKKGEYALVTVHRAANTDNKERLYSIISAFSQLPTRVVFPAHPRTRKVMREWGIFASPNIVFIEPVGHFDMLALQESSNCILTDSGGIQKEAYLLGVRCITLREETEWVETVNAGWNQLAGTNKQKIVDLYATWFPREERPPVYGNGHSAKQICSLLLDYLT
jgi:UDP-N-acetylglucosamine 2-epimerase